MFNDLCPKQQDAIVNAKQACYTIGDHSSPANEVFSITDFMLVMELKSFYGFCLNYHARII